LPYSQNQIVQEATKIPQKAFEAYVKAVQLPLNEPLRENYLKNAVRFYSDASSGAVYPQASFELSRTYMTRGNWKDATEYFSKLQKKDPHYAGPLFTPVSVTRSLGLQSRACYGGSPLFGLPRSALQQCRCNCRQAARDNKNDAERNRLLAQGISFLSRAAESPEDPMVHFNYAMRSSSAGSLTKPQSNFVP
jgi:tetratricopeptide (TPR) repeat protein